MATTIKLQKPVNVFGVEVHDVRIQEPSGFLYLQFGEPRLAVSLGPDGGYWIEQPKTIQDYLERVLDYGDGKAKDVGALLALLSFADAKAVKKALFDFFHEAAPTPTK